jgi:hypothetical protein
MPVIRLILVLGIVGGLAALAVSNGASMVSLMFLGMATPTLPLAVWLLGAIAAGMVTTLAINLLFSLSNYWAVRQVQPRSLRRPPSASVKANPAAKSVFQTGRPARPAAAKSEGDEAWQNWDGYEDSQRARPASPGTRIQDLGSENVRRAAESDDWDFMVDDDWDAVPRPASPAPTPSPGFGSYSDRAANAPKPATADKSKLVVDADYRVIIPPYKASPPPEGPETD